LEMAVPKNGNMWQKKKKSCDKILQRQNRGRFIDDVSNISVVHLECKGLQLKHAF